MGRAVGKGLNVKGKSAKRGRLSGFVPFLQISDNRHKQDVEASMSDAPVQLFFQRRDERSHALLHFETILADADALPKVKARTVKLIDAYPDVYGLELPEALLHKVFITDSDLTFPVGWETGRVSEPAFMDMNLHALRDKGEPRVVLLQADLQDPLNAHGLLMAYAEATVKPVVSDFDTFLVGSRGMEYETLPPEQVELAKWALGHTRDILELPDQASWTSRWLEVLRSEAERGFQVDMPRYGFGDATSYRLIQRIVDATKETGAVRHGAECFNFLFPQELEDDSYLVIWEGLGHGHWEYMAQDELRSFLLARAREGFSFPLNPVWLVRDSGWYEIFTELQAHESTARALAAWYPPGSNLTEKVQELHDKHPRGFRRDLSRTCRKVTLFSDLCGCEKADLVFETVRKDVLARKFRNNARAVVSLGIGKRLSRAPSRAPSPRPFCETPQPQPPPRGSDLCKHMEKLENLEKGGALDDD